jgi:hypothetical protein
VIRFGFQKQQKTQTNENENYSLLGELIAKRSNKFCNYSFISELIAKLSAATSFAQTVDSGTTGACTRLSPVRVGAFRFKRGIASRGKKGDRLCRIKKTVISTRKRNKKY